MELSFIFYIISSALVILGTVYYNFRARRYVSATLLGGGFIALSILYGLYIFNTSGGYNEKPVGGKWPPTINSCPDFLSMVTVNGVTACVDPIGVAKGPNPLRKWTDTGSTGSEYVFDLMLNLNGKARTKALCDQCKVKGLTWEGITDGTNCLTNNVAPVPVSQTA